MEDSVKTVYLLRVSLDRVDPEVWRTMVVPAEIELPLLHKVIQASMGWYDSHLHEFQFGSERYGNNPEMHTEPGVKLSDVASGTGHAFKYLYDFGDGWEHTVEIIAETRAVLSDAPIKLLEGANACPPEDVGGPAGYERFCEIIDDQDHIEHEFFFDWNGGDFDRTEFDLGEAQALVAALVD